MRAAWHQSAFLPILGLLVGGAWILLWLWAASPYGRYLDHGSWLQTGIAGAICRSLPAGEVLLPGLLYVGGWLLMSAAMMLPTTLPLLEIFRRTAAARPDRHRLLLLPIAGYLAVWGAFGLIAHLADLGVQALVLQSPWLTFNAWAVGALVLATAGLFQFSALKHRCLEECRTPFSFVARHWGHDRPAWRSFRLGAHHGLFCVGCCWALMLVMFAAGVASMIWIALLTALMVHEKTQPSGHRTVPVTGVVLLAMAAVVLLASAQANGAI
jgi:predicted metal-binding membrane protein